MKRMAVVLLAAGLLSLAAQAQNEPNETFGPAPTPTPTPTAMPGQPAEFNAGIKAMNDSHWKEALEDFDKVHGADEKTMEQALYWKAYNLQKLDRNEESADACRALRRTYPKSSWNGECAQLRANKVYFLHSDDMSHFQVDVDGLRAQTEGLQEQAQLYADQAREYGNKTPFVISTDGPGPKKYTVYTTTVDPNDEIKLIALNSLMQQEPEKALPLLRAFLTSDKPVEVRRRAMFVLEQSRSPEAQKLLADMATSNKEPELQRAAVWALASHAKDHTAELVAIYKGSSDHEVKRAAASGLRSAFDTKDLIDLARAENDADMKRTLVNQISEMHDPEALPYLEELAK